MKKKSPESDPKPEVTQDEFPKSALLILPVILLKALALQTVFGEWGIAQNFISQPFWKSTVETLGGTFDVQESGLIFANIGLLPFLVFSILISALIIGVSGFLMKKTTDKTLIESVGVVATRFTIWWAVPGVWFLLWFITLIAGLVPITDLLVATIQFWFAIPIAGTILELSKIFSPVASQKPAASLKTETSFRIPILVWCSILAYVVIFTGMNWGLWFNLRLPHGDSSMYEEHLWNVLNGKGFRSYLDQGLFLGEHIQVIHLFLMPIYYVFPSHLTLELCESLALASGAIPIYWMTVRQTESRQAGIAMVVCYLLYFPMQFLDIAIDLKTFRPTAFGVPAVLFALDQFDRKRFWSCLILLFLALLAKEEYAIIVCCFGLWILISTFLESREAVERKISLWRQPVFRFGLLLTLLGPIYLKTALSAIVWFRSGVEVHYAGYFSKFGESTSEIIITMMTNPRLLFSELITLSTLIYALAVLVPMGFVAVFSPLRMIFVGGPFFILLCLNELARDPRHHFHAPLIPVLFWAAAWGIPVAANKFKQFLKSDQQTSFMPQIAVWSAGCAFGTALFFSLSPISITFWDSGSSWNWKNLYVPSKRAEMFAKIESTISKTARVASTDFIHPRFTHHERSYDYSEYARKVSAKGLRIPEDTDYIVIDTQHPYSIYKKPEDVIEYNEHPEEWEMLPDETEGYFMVFKKVKR